MPERSRSLSLILLLALLVTACQPAAPAPTAQQPAGDTSASKAPAEKAQPAKTAAQTRVIVGVTETVEKYNPYADSVSLMYGIWCEIYGCLVGYEFDQGEYVGKLAESWKVENPSTWIFTLRKEAKFSDGTPVTAADWVHTIDRINNDTNSRQKQNVAPIAKAEAVDDYTLKLTTKEPTASLLDYLSDRVMVTSKALYEQHGDSVYRDHPVGAGPYMLKEIVPDQRLSMVKTPDWWGGKVEGPDEVVYRVMRETEVRTTALLNNELQIAQFIPPHMAERVTGNPGTKIVPVDSIEIMFLAMQPKPPFDKKEVRQAVAYAIDREAIIQNVLLGYAQVLHGPIGPGQYGYNPELQPRYEYNPAKAKELLAQAGYPNGVDVNLSTPVGRYTQDKQISEAITQMLNEVGIRATLQTPEWSTLWDNVQKGNVPFYYMGRGSVLDPGNPLAQYFETGGSPRIGYSNPELDALFTKERASFDPAERKQALSELMSLLTEEAPAHFLWRHQLLYGMAENIEYTPRPDARMYASNMKVKR